MNPSDWKGSDPYELFPELRKPDFKISFREVTRNLFPCISDEDFESSLGEAFEQVESPLDINKFLVVTCLTLKLLDKKQKQLQT